MTVKGVSDEQTHCSTADGLLVSTEITLSSSTSRMVLICKMADSYRGDGMGVVFKMLKWTLVLLLLHSSCLRCVKSQHYFSPNDLDGLQSLWEAWNASTPNKEINLFNWVTTVDDPQKLYPCYNQRNNWRGVTCLRYAVNDTVANTWVVGLELADASISGTLPPGIKELTKLVTLSLTGNPNLRGSLPRELGDLPLNVLQLNDNGFSGTIPSELSNLNNLLELDLSGNKLVDRFPTQVTATGTLQSFKIGRNMLDGEIEMNSFEILTQLLTVDLSSNSFTGSIPNFTNLGNLYNLNISRNNFTNLPQLSQLFKGWLRPNSQLRVLDVSGLKFGGVLPDWNSIPDLLSLERLYFDNININGGLDLISMRSSIQNLKKSNKRTLQVLSLRNNNIVDVSFDKSLLTSGGILFYLQGNPYCNDFSKDVNGKRCYCEQYCPTFFDEPKRKNWKIIVITTSICIFLLGSIFLCILYILHQKNKNVRALLKRFEESDVRTKQFDYKELCIATKNFAKEKKLGQGSYGAVYKGILSNNTEIAVKQLFLKTKKASEEFLNEVLLISNLQHRNLVSLKGYCLHGKEMLLVYEFVEYCDLDKLLLQGSKNIGGAWQVVIWPARMRICLGIAHGLYYLHASSQTKIIHRDIKASNILLDKNLNPKIADFGLARPMQDERSEILTQQRAGTIGYLAPEYMLYGQLSEKADVYSFGVLLLEIVSGTRNKDPTKSDNDVYLPMRAWKLYKENKLMEVIDSKLHISEDEIEEVHRVLEVALLCVQSSPEKRPTMFRVVAILSGDANIGNIPMDTDSCYFPDLSMPLSHTHDDMPLLPISSTSTIGSNQTIGQFTNGHATIEMTSINNGR